MLTSDEYVARLSAATAAVLNRPKREDCPSNKHDPAFSEWQTLVGPDDWKGYELGKEGVERYRTRNLPDCTCCPGVYELGIVISAKPDYRSTKPVYVGQADNVRNRLQQYGRDGNHLENSCSDKVEFPLKKGNGSCQKGCRLFRQAFSGGFSIVYRWAPMKSKEEAEKTEAALLNKYNYAWNKVSNGARRRDDVVNKTKPPSIIKLQKGFRIKAPELDDLVDEEDDHYRPIQKERHYVHGPIIECKSSSNGYKQKITGKACKQHTICGFGLSNGTFCTEKPPEGRKRCEEHKGLKIKDSIISQIPDSGSRKGHGNGAASPSINGSQTCGATLKDGRSCCSRIPAEGNRRCWQHNGMITVSSPTSFPALPSTCGAPTLAGHTCSRQPAAGSIRCWQHAEGKSSGSSNHYMWSPRSSSYSSYGSFYGSSSSICSAMTRKGYPCSRSADAGSSRCWQH